MIMTADEIANEITMSYSHEMHLIVEGVTDQTFFISVFQNQPHVNIVCASGADGVIDVIAHIDKHNPTLKKTIPVLGIIDRDYRIPIKNVPLISNILLTDYRDLECMMINSPCLWHVLNELGSFEKINKFGNEAAIRTRIIDACKIVGELRYFSQSEKINLTFKGLDYEKFVDKKSLTLDPIKFANHISGSQPAGTTRITEATLKSAKLACSKAKSANGAKYFTHDLLICRGHDLTSLISIGLRSLWGSRRPSDQTISTSVIEGYFRMAYLSHFKLSFLYSSISGWVAAQSFKKIIVM